MASRVNTRFVTFLAIGLMLLGGGAMVAVYFALKKSGADYAVLGDQFMSEGVRFASQGDNDNAEKQYEKAAEYYSKAVFRERTNATWIDKWLTAMEKTTPRPRSAYLDRYIKDYQQALKGYSDALPEDVAAQKRFLREQYERMRITVGVEEPWNAFIQEVEDAMKRFGTEDGPVRELRRYRAFANMFKLMILPEEKQKDLVGPIEADLAAALAANPNDEDVIAEIANMKMRRAEEARKAKDEAAADRLEKEASDSLGEYMKSHGVSSRVLWRQMQIDFVRLAKAAETRGVPITRTQLYDDQNQRFVEVMSVLQNEPKEKLDLVVLSQLAGEAARSGKIGNAGVLELLYALEAKNPDRMFLKMLIGRFEILSQHHDKAVAAYQKVIDAPDLPLSFDGWVLFEQRAEAYRQQILAKLTARETAQKKLDEVKENAGVAPGEPAKLLAEAKALRTKLGEYVGESDRMLLYVDAKIAYAEGNFESARISLDRYNERSADQDVGALMLFASIMEKVGNTGAARTAYDKVLKKDPDYAQALLSLADLEQREQNYAAAKKNYEAAKKLFPTSLELEERLNKVSLLLEGGGKDVVTKAMVDAQKLVSGVNPDYAGAAAILRRALDASGDLTLYPVLTRVLQLDGQKEAAISVINEGLNKAPGNPRLLAMLKSLKIEDPLEAMLVAINEDEQSSAFQKHVWRHLVYTQYSKKDEAQRELDEAAKLDPEHGVVLELKFRAALLAKNMPEARRIADLAATKDADHVDGLTYKAQLEVADGRLSDAAASLEAALEKDRNSVPVWRQLGTLRLAMGKADAAATAFDRALAIRPNDIDAIKGMMRAKIAGGQREEALIFARKNQNVGVQDAEFVDAWLGLEAVAVGGDRAKALQMRDQLAKRSPDNERNNVSLVMLLLDAQRWADARTMIDKLRGSADRPSYVELDVRWSTAQNNMRNAIETFNRWVTTLPADKHTEAPYISLAGIFMDYGKYDAAILSLEDGRKHQDPKTMGADRKLGEVQFLTQRYAQCIETYNRVLAADPKDPEYRVSGQIVEAYIRLSKFADAKKLIDALGGGVESNSRMLLLKAEILAGLGQLEEAGRTYDAAVAAAKEDPIGYIKRAEFLGRDPQRMGDAQQDLRQALALSPRLLGARRLLTDLHMRRNEPDKAVEVLREGLRADPDNDALRWDLVGLHLRLKQDQDAMRLVEDALARRNEDPLWLFRGREVMYALQRFDDATTYAWRLWEKKKDADAALAYLDAALKMKTTDFVKAMQVLQTPELNIQKDIRLLIARARLQLKRQRTQEATADLDATLKMIDQNNLGQARTFMAGMTVVYENDKDRLAAMTALRAKEGYRGWLGFLYSNLKAGVPETEEEGMAELVAMGQNAANDLNLRKQAYSVIGSRWRAKKKHDDAIRWWEEGRKLDSADPELNNNVAYSLAEDLKKPQEALPYAERAAAAMPNNPSIQDTLGTIYMMLGDLEKADQALSRALSLVQGPEDGVAVLLHLAQLRILQNRKDDAGTLIRRAEELMKSDPRLQQQYAPLLTEVKGKLTPN